MLVNASLVTVALSTGFVYVLTNRAMDGLVKVGFSSHLPEDRAKKLTTTGVPLPFEVRFRALTSRPSAVEKVAHTLLADHRVASNREFFRTTPEAAIEAVRQALLDEAGIESWDVDAPISIRNGDRVALTLRASQIFALLEYPENSTAKPIDIWEAHSDGDLLELGGTDSPTHVAGFGSNDPGALTDPVPYLDRNGDAVNGLINGQERILPGQRLVWLDGHTSPDRCNFTVFDAETYCQVFSRTWRPRTLGGYFPLILNYLSRELTQREILVLRAIVRLAPPAHVRHAVADEEVRYGTDIQSPEYWLHALQKRNRNQGRRPRGK
jgi:T5orf172 domain.